MVMRSNLERIDELRSCGVAELMRADESCGECGEKGMIHIECVRYVHVGHVTA